MSQSPPFRHTMINSICMPKGGYFIFTEVFKGIMLPFVGTTLGAVCVFFIGKRSGKGVYRAICGFSAGVMLAASIWSLLIPSMELAEGRGVPAAIPAASGFLGGVVFFLLCDRLILKKSALRDNRAALPIFAVAVHNLPEGMAVGAIYAEALCTGNVAALPAALALSIGIAVQNLPEGAIVSMPLHANGHSKLGSFTLGVLSGVVEPIGALLTILAAGIAVPILPYLLGFAAGAMMYAVLEEFGDGAGNVWVMSFACGFVLMMSLDVLLG